jgi:hypothetical protein
MNKAISEDDFVRLPEGHEIRLGVDWLFYKGRWWGVDEHCTITGGDLYCRRSDYPKPKRVLHEMALSDRTGMSFCWVWPEKVARHEESGWFATGRTREVTHETGT